MNLDTTHMQTQLGDLLGSNPRVTFKPIAYYEKHMDCIRIEFRDCSMTEVRVSEYLTILEDNYPGPTQKPYVGLMIKGVRACFKEWGIPLEGVVMVTTILDQLLKTLPEDPENIAPPEMEKETRDAIVFINETADTIELGVNMDVEAIAA